MVNYTYLLFHKVICDINFNNACIILFMFELLILGVFKNGLSCSLSVYLNSILVTCSFGHDAPTDCIDSM